MRTVGLMLLSTLLWFPSMAAGQSLTPLGDDVQDPLLPTGISQGDVEIFGAKVYLSSADDGAEVIHVIGEFELHIGQRRYLSAREAVIFFESRKWERRSYQHFEVYLWRDAHIIESAGTVTSAPVLYALLNSIGKVIIGADATSREGADRGPVYREAVRIRDLVARADLGDIEAQPAIHVIDLESTLKSTEPEVRPVFYFKADQTRAGIVDGRQVASLIGGVYAFQEGKPSLELRADAAVLFMAVESTDAAQSDEEEGVQQPPADLIEQRSVSGVALPGMQAGAMGGGQDVEGIYLEGDVVMTRGGRMIRASRLYYDIAHDRALVLDAVARILEPTRGVPIYIRAEKVRQLSTTEYRAWDALISSSEFHTPHFAMGASEVKFTDSTAKTATGVPIGLRAGTFEAWHTTLDLGGSPVSYWPYTKGDFKEGVSLLRGLRTGFSSRFGASIETKWHLADMMGLSNPVGFDSTLRLDYYSDRGPAGGIDVDYERENYFGLARTYYINDQGKDNLGRYRNEKPDTENRGRALIRHRQYLANDWQLTLEASYITDRGFLEEYFENEFDDGKEQETLLYLKKQVDTWSFTLLAQWRILDWTTQTEHLPEVEFRMIGEPLGDTGITFYSENRAGFVRYRPGQRDLLEYIFVRPKEDSSGVVARVETRQELEFPFTLGPLKIVPFASVRGTAWDDSPELGGTQRLFGTAGVRASMYLSRIFPDVHSDLLDIDGLRHIIKADATGWVAGSSRDSNELYPFTANVEDIDEISGATMGVRQRWQTKRGGPGRKRVVDLLMLDIEAGFFNDAPSRDREDLIEPLRERRLLIPNTEITNGFASYSRPENSISRNYLSTAMSWRINDSTALISESNFDLNDGEMAVFNLAYVVERDPRFSYLVAYRYIGETDSNLLALGANYRISDKHTIAFRESFDLDRGQTEEFTIGFIRKYPRWYVGLTIDVNEADDDFGVSISAWPEGLPRSGLGSRRFTGLTQSTGVRPN